LDNRYYPGYARGVFGRLPRKIGYDTEFAGSTGLPLDVVVKFPPDAFGRGANPQDPGLEFVALSLD
jgi:hypothetical protein